MARPPNTDARKAQIVRGLMRVLADRGYERATVQSIAEAASLSPGLVHYHFENKQQILVALAEELAAGVDRRIEQMKGSAESREVLFEFLDAYVATGEGADPDAVACWVALGSEALRVAEVHDVYRRTLESAGQMLDEVVFNTLHDEGRDTDDYDTIVLALLAVIEGTFQIATLLPETFRPGAASRMLRAIAAGLLDARPLLAKKPPATTASATPPARTKPAVTKPAATKPEATKPAATKPAATKPATAKPSATQPAAANPATSTSLATRSATTKAATSKAGASNAAATKAAATKAAATKSVAAKAAATKAATTKAAVTKAAATKSVATNAVATKTAATKSATTKAAVTKAAASKPRSAPSRRA